MSAASALANDNDPENEQPKKHIPGEVGVWVFILGDMIIFLLFFCVFMYSRGEAPELYSESQAALNKNYGAINTLLLLTSSLAVVLAMNSVRNHFSKAAPMYFSVALACGVGFAVVKVFEYGEKINEGISILTNDFYMYYYILTGIHMIHVIIGLGVLIYLIQVTKKTRDDNSVTPNMVTLESGASYWHMVDLLWIGLFSLLYLMS